MPTLMGYDSDHPRSLGEVGREGVAIDSLDDMETLFDGHPARRGLDVDDDQRAGGDAARVLRRASASSRASPRAELRGTIQTDILKEYIAQKEWIFPPEPSMRLVDGHDRVLRARDAAAGTRSRSPATTSARPARRPRRSSRSRSPTASPTSSAALERGLDVDDFAPRLSFFFNAHLDFFEEIAKYRAARRIWARELRDRYGAKNPRSWLMRFHTQTAGVSLTAQQPEVNIVRTAIEALAAVLGGTQSLHTNSLRRGARAADRGRGADRAAHAAGDRARDRRRQHDRPARRLLLRRAADERARARRPTTTSTGSRSSAASSRRSRRTSSSARSPRRRSATSPRSRRSSASSSASTATSSRTSSRSRSSGSTRRSSRSRSSACRRCARGATRRRSRRALARAEGGAAREDAQPDAADHRRRRART